MTPRDAILGKIRKELGRAAGQHIAPLAAPALRIPLLDRNLYKDLFVQNFEKLAGKALVVRNTSDVLSALAPLLEGKTIVASNAPFLRTCGITESGLTDRQRLTEACATADIGITSVDYALAATGTLVMLASPREARLISLLPPVHIAIIPRSKIIANLDELLSILPKPAEQTSSMVLITGPSRTADIEQILVRGVHGPGEIHAIIVDES
jgi:L-lactate dehydrogenase complex protein LldG